MAASNEIKARLRNHWIEPIGKPGVSGDQPAISLNCLCESPLVAKAVWQVTAQRPLGMRYPIARVSHCKLVSAFAFPYPKAA